MCGIFAYIGPRPLVDVLVSGLKRLEYRGYDSAGISYAEGDSLRVYKQKGKVASLSSTMSGVVPTKTQAGISHTRWATHGEPSTLNAHPHLDEHKKIAIVHNGIIENYKIIKKRLIEQGMTFRSETDTEVLVQLISFFRRRYDFITAVKKALSKVTGAFGIAVIDIENPDVIIGARKGSPFILGIGENETFISSDPAAVVPYTKQAIYLEDDDFVVVKSDGYHLSNLSDENRVAEITEIEYDSEMVEKNGYDHYMLKEIFEQKETILNTFRGRLLPDTGDAKLGGLNIQVEDVSKIKRILFLACGTSWHSCLIGEYLLENLAGIPTEVEYASEFTTRNCVLEEGTLVFAVSQSGETADTLAALREAKNKGAMTRGIVNVVGSSIARETDGGIYLHAGPEIGVASTKAFTSQVTAMLLITLFFARKKFMSLEQGRRIIKELHQIGEKIDLVLKQGERIREISAKYLKPNNALYLGRSYNFPVALEGALKLKEISYIHAEGYPAAEMKHGPIALIDEAMPVIVVATHSETYHKVVSNIQEVRARKGVVIGIASEGDTTIAEHCNEVIYVPRVEEALSPLINVIPLQLLSYYAAVQRGTDVDQPRNLAKSVTVE